MKLNMACRVTKVLFVQWEHSVDVANRSTLLAKYYLFASDFVVNWYCPANDRLKILFQLNDMNFNFTRLTAAGLDVHKI